MVHFYYGVAKCYFPQYIVFLSLKIDFVLVYSADPDEKAPLLAIVPVQAVPV